MKTKSKSRVHKDQNYLPDQIGRSFEAELDQLVSNMAETKHPKCMYLHKEYKSKYLSKDTLPPDERRAAAITKWMTVEASNANTNFRLEFEEEFGWVTADELFTTAAGFVAQCLGPMDESVFVGGTHTNGASTRVARSPKAAIQKHVGEAHVTSAALPYWYLFAANTVLSDQELQLVDASVLFTVPKSSDIDRVACKEPEINMLLQRIVGSRIRKKLRKSGINLNDQTINQRLAKAAHSEGLATIDLSSASDSISQTIVRRLLPRDWWNVLDDLRVHHTLVDGERHSLKMFSSMGNGFTFELESLIFWALTRAVCKHSKVRGKISIYGDDIICPAAIGARLARVFAWFGFKVNTKKSNWSGPLRESCGKHYHRGLDVTPFYVRAPVRFKTDIIRLLNRLLLWDDCGFMCLSTPEVIDFHSKWSKQVPKELHGGQDPESDSSLVTGGEPSKRLLRKIRPWNFDQQAGLLFWLTVRETTALPLSCDPGDQGRFFVANQPPELYRTAWDPYLIKEDLPICDHCP